MLTDLRILLVAVALFVLPGWAMLTYLLPDEPLSRAEKFGLSAGLSLCVYPLLLLWSRVIGVPPGRFAAAGPLAAALVALAWRHRGTVRYRPAQIYHTLREWRDSPSFLPDLALGGLALLLFGVRLFVVHDIQVPFWGDSVQHTAISQLIVDHGGLFDSWLPYTPYKTLTVHFGFHSHVAAFHWLSGIPIPRAVLVTGQVINALAILTLVPLAHRMFQSRWAGVGAMAVAGLLGPLPMVYVNWGRYPQLAGQAVLPIAVWLSWQLADTSLTRDAERHSPSAIVRSRAWSLPVLTGLALAGMFLCYYRAPFYYVAFIAAWVLAWALPRWRSDWNSWARWALRLVASGLVMLVLVSPWLLHLTEGKLVTYVEGGMAQATTVEQVLREYEVWRDLPTLIPKPLMALAGLGLLWGTIHRRNEILTIGLWVVGLVGLVALGLTRLPGSNFMRSFAIMISLYLPAGLLGGYALDVGLHSLAGNDERWKNAVVAGALLSVSLWGAWQRSTVINSQYRLVAPADLAAMDWIRANTPHDAHFLVDGFAVHNGTSIVGSDAGWWIPLLAGRQNTIPPQYALLNEQPHQPGYGKAMSDLVVRLREVGVTSPGGRQLLCRHEITHVYVGQGQGQVAIPPPKPMLSTTKLQASPHFMTLYRKDRASVFAFDRETCPVKATGG